MASADVKQVMITNPLLSLFDQSRGTVVSSDASSYGLRVVLLQRQPDDELFYISRSQPPTEEHYAQIEDTHNFTWAHECFSDFSLVMEFCIVTDNKLWFHCLEERISTSFHFALNISAFE